MMNILLTNTVTGDVYAGGVEFAVDAAGSSVEIFMLGFFAALAWGGIMFTIRVVGRGVREAE